MVDVESVCQLEPCAEDDLRNKEGNAFSGTRKHPTIPKGTSDSASVSQTNIRNTASCLSVGALLHLSMAQATIVLACKRYSDSKQRDIIATSA